MIVLVSQYKFPAGDAGSIRIHGFACTLLKIGELPFVIGNGCITKNVKFFKRIPYISLRQKNRWLNSITFPIRLFAYLSSVVKTHKVRTIIVGTVDNQTFISLKLFCRLYNILLIKDAVEWYSKCQAKSGAFLRSYIEKNIENKYLISSSVSVIAISRYLEKYFKNKKIKTVRIPIYMDQSFSLRRNVNPDKVTITYAGQPGAKDLIHVILKTVSLFDEDVLRTFDFNLIGCSKDQVIRSCEENNIDYDKIRSCVNIVGRISRDEVLKYLTKSDFTILIRNPNERYSQAGFPSKIIECITYGVVPIMNYSSDLKLYFKDNINSIIVDGYDSTALKVALIRAINLPYSERNRLSANAKALASEKFDINSYKSELEQIIIH